MGRFLRSLPAAVLLGLVLTPAAAQAQLYGVNAFSNDLSQTQASEGFWSLNLNTGAIGGGYVVVVPGRTITGLNSITVDPTSGTMYAIAKASGVSGQLLITIDKSSGAALGVEIGNLGDDFSSLTFRADGQLFGVTDEGAVVPNTLYLVDKTNASKAIATSLGDGAAGEVIAFNPRDGFIYNWSGDSTVVFEKIQSVSPFAVTGIPITGTQDGEVFGAVWDECRGQFLVHDINARMAFWTADGVISNLQATTLSPVRGLALLPANICAVDASVTNVVPASVLAGANLTYAITAGEVGSGAADNATLTDTLPAGTTFVSLSAPGWSCTTPAVGAGGSVICTNPSFALGTAVFALVVQVEALLPGGTVLSDTATISTTTTDLNPANNATTVTTTVSAPTSVSATKTASGSFVPGGSIVYTVVLTNNSTSTQGDNPGPEFSDVLPAGTTLVSASATSGTAVATVGTNTVTWDGSIPPSGSVTITINAVLGAALNPGTMISNQGTVFFDADGNGTNESSAATDDPGVGGAANPTVVTIQFAMLGSPVPTLSPGALAALMFLLGLVGTLAIRRIS